MNMIQMLGIVTVLYFVTLALLVFNNRRINTRIGNFLFITADVIFYAAWMYSLFLNSGNFTVSMLIGQISPMTCALLPLTCIMSERCKSYAYSGIAFLNFGLFVAMFISPEHAYLFNFYNQASLYHTAEALCHMLCSLFGIYLVLTEQIKADFKHWIKSIVFMYSIITIGVGINYVFHQSLFGMDPYGNYSIYMIDIFGSFEATIFAYYTGVLVVLTLGMQSAYIWKRIADRLHKHTEEERHAERASILDIDKSNKEKSI